MPLKTLQRKNKILWKKNMKKKNQISKKIKLINEQIIFSIIF